MLNWTGSKKHKKLAVRPIGRTARLYFCAVILCLISLCFLPVVEPGEAAFAGLFILVAQVQAGFLHGTADHIIADAPGAGEEVT